MTKKLSLAEKAINKLSRYMAKTTGMPKEMCKMFVMLSLAEHAAKDKPKDINEIVDEISKRLITR